MSKFVKPGVDPTSKQPYQVRLPQKPTEFMPAYGAEVPNDVNWYRRIKDGSVVEITAAEFKKGKAAAEKAAAKQATKTEE